MKTVTLTIDARTEIMRLMRAYDVPDEKRGSQREARLVGPRYRDDQQERCDRRYDARRPA